MQFRILFPIVICLAAIAAPASRAEDAAAAEPPKGRLLLMGGAEREDNPVLWNELLVLAGGTGARVAVFPTGSHNPEKTGAALSARLRRLGLAPFVVPVGELGDYPDSRRIVADPKWVERPLLVVTPRAGCRPEREALIALLGQHFPRWMLPDDVVVLDQLPHTATGKIMKTRLREMFAGYTVAEP